MIYSRSGSERGAGMIDGGLFTKDFLEEGIRETPAYAALGSAVAGKVHDVIVPTLDLVGWAHRLYEKPLNPHGREDVPDLLLFPDHDSKLRAAALRGGDTYRHGACLVEAKRWELRLDRADATSREGVPSMQIARYLRRAEEATDGRLRWGILTNGGKWRLYHHRGVPGEKAFFEVDVARVVAPI